MTKAACTFGLSLFLLAAPALAQTTRVVDNDGQGSIASCDDLALTFAAIGAAVAASVSGDTVRVCPGTYFENVSFAGKNITLRSVAGPAVTIIDGGATDSVVTFAAFEGPGAILDGFTIRNGRSGFDTPGFGDGGGIRVVNASPAIRHNFIVNNEACSGVGISVDFGSPVIEGNTISNNTQGGCSGGVGGGGIAIGGASAVVVRDNVISHNTIVGASGGGISLFAAGTPLIERNIISDNTASGLFPCAQGGGIWMVNQSDATIVGNSIVRNRAGCGGGIYWLVPQGPIGPRLVNNTIADNDSPQGSGIFADGFDAASELINNIIVAAPEQTAVLCGNFNDPNPPIFRFNDVFSASGTEYGGICTDQTGLNGNISGDPLFANPGAEDYHVRAGSPVIDTGDNNVVGLPAVDLDGNSRILNGDAVPAAVVDMGADELSPLPTLTMKVNGQHPEPPLVTTPGPVQLTLNVSPTTYTATLDWYWALVINGQTLWVTSGGLSPVPAPLASGPPVVFSDVTLLNVVLPPGTNLTSVFFLVNGPTLVGVDVVTALVVGT
jgi:parallel beta-helix repeat protein